MTHVSTGLKHDIFRLLSVRVLVSDHSVSCFSDERICQVVKAQIWELEDLVTVPEAATAHL